MDKKECEQKLKKLFSSESEYEMQMFKSGVDTLKRIAKPKDIAYKVVAEWYGIKTIDAKHICTGEFIELLIGIAPKFDRGCSVNNIRDHINNMLSDEDIAWKARRKEFFSKTSSSQGNKICLQLNLILDGEHVEELLEILRKAKFCQISESNFDGDADNKATIYEFEGTPSTAVGILRDIEKHADKVKNISVKYISEAMQFERPNLTLQQALQYAEHEAQIR